MCRLEILSVFVVLIAVLVVGASVVVWGEERASAIDGKHKHILCPFNFFATIDRLDYKGHQKNSNLSHTSIEVVLRKGSRNTI